MAGDDPALHAAEPGEGAAKESYPGGYAMVVEVEAYRSVGRNDRRTSCLVEFKLGPWGGWPATWRLSGFSGFRPGAVLSRTSPVNRCCPTGCGKRRFSVGLSSS